MAGEWLPMSVDLWTSPEVMRLSAFCQQHVSTVSGRVSARCTAIGALFRIWTIVDIHCSNGVMPNYTPADIDSEVGIDGWAAAMESVGWLEVTPEGVAIPGFEKWFSRSAKRRKLNAQYQRDSRERAQKPVSNVSAQKLTTEENRREEKRTVKVEPNGPTCDAPPGQSPAAAKSQSEFGFPIKHGKTWYLTTRKLDEYRDTYGDKLDLDAEFKAARQWLRDNKDRRKTATGMPAFLTGWLNRTLDKQPSGTNGKPDYKAILEARRAKRHAKDDTTSQEATQ